MVPSQACSATTAFVWRFFTTDAAIESRRRPDARRCRTTYVGFEPENLTTSISNAGLKPRALRRLFTGVGTRYSSPETAGNGGLNATALLADPEIFRGRLPRFAISS